MKLHRPVFAAVLFLGAIAAGRDALDRWVARTRLPSLVVERSVELRDRDGMLLRAFTVGDGRWRLGTGLVEVDPRFIAMLVAYEDKRYWHHAGIDPWAMIRAGLQAMREGRIVSGASTLTMQTARLLEEGSTGRWAGKLRQIRLALALERVLSKEEILTLYLNLAPYGGNLEGVRSASLGYFGKEPRRLTPAQAALLVALPQAPERRRPDRSATQARAGRDRVLKRMGAVGLLPISDVQDALRGQIPDRRIVFPRHAPHLADRLRAERPARRVHHTTLDGAAQRRVEKLAASALHGYQEELSLAILVANHQTGDVLISVGSRGYDMERAEGFLDMTRAVRSPGSTLKPLVYGLAFDRGLAHPETLIDDRPMRFGTYAPQNFDRRFRGTLRIREALQASLNLPVVAILNALGPATLLQALRRGGSHPRVPTGRPGLAIGLGGLGLTLEELVQNYASLARGGRAVRLIYRKGEDTIEGPRILNPAAAWHVTDILSGVPRPPNAPSMPVALKTGTSYGHRDAWAIGYDGAHVVGVWVGRADGTPVPGVFGADLAAPLVFEVLARLSMSHVPLPYAPAAALTVGNADLPFPLQRFGARAGRPDPSKPIIAFPPDGATLETSSPIFAKLQEGHAPFTWLVNGVPVISGSRERQVSLPAISGRGYQTLAVIDAAGRSNRVTVFID